MAKGGQRINGAVAGINTKLRTKVDVGNNFCWRTNDGEWNSIPMTEVASKVGHGIGHNYYSITIDEVTIPLVHGACVVSKAMFSAKPEQAEEIRAAMWAEFTYEIHEAGKNANPYLKFIKKMRVSADQHLTEMAKLCRKVKLDSPRHLTIDAMLRLV